MPLIEEEAYSPFWKRRPSEAAMSLIRVRVRKAPMELRKRRTANSSKPQRDC